LETLFQHQEEIGFNAWIDRQTRTHRAEFLARGFTTEDVAKAQAALKAVGADLDGTEFYASTSRSTAETAQALDRMDAKDRKANHADFIRFMRAASGRFAPTLPNNLNPALNRGEARLELVQWETDQVWWCNFFRGIVAEIHQDIDYAWGVAAIACFWGGPASPACEAAGGAVATLYTLLWAYEFFIWTSGVCEGVR
jgi:hypothetical protein